jgi:glycosyltransferase involved in cell wall biosynthesis
MAFSNSGAPSISAFFPAFNDAENLRVQIPRTIETLQQLTGDYEVIVVDDGSTDDTSAVLDSLRQQFPCLRVVRHAKNLGYGAALQSGFRNSAKELIFYTDGDGQYDSGELRNLLAELSPEVDVVNGFKIHRADSAHRSIVGNTYQKLVKTLFRLKIRDVDCDFRLVRRQVMETIQLTSLSGAICVDLMCQIERGGHQVAEVPVHHYPRLHGHSQFFRVMPVIRTALDIFRLWVRLILLKRASAPRRTTRRAHGID